MAEFTPEPSETNLMWQHRVDERHRYVPVDVRDNNIMMYNLRGEKSDVFGKRIELRCRFCDVVSVIVTKWFRSQGSLDVIRYYDDSRGLITSTKQRTIMTDREIRTEKEMSK